MLLNKDNIILKAAILFMVACFFVSFKAAAPMGDGVEYILNALSFYEHLTPFITNSTLELYDFYYQQDFVNQIKHFYDSASMINGNFSISNGIIFTENGKMLTLHFWLYSLFATPFLFLTQLAKLAPHHAFLLCNWAFIFLVFYYIKYQWIATKFQKFTLFSLYFLFGTSYYLWWTHPEVLTSSLLLLSILLISDKKFILAYLSLAIAATQNPPLVFLLMIYMAYEWVILYKKGVLFNFNTLLKLGITGIGIGLIIISPMLFFYSQIAVLNPITAINAANIKLISFDRLFSFYFDLNQGLIIALPCIFVYIMYLCFRFTEHTRAIKFVLIGILVSIILVIPSMSTFNWNHGQTVFNRYGYWISIPILYSIVISISENPKRAKKIAYLLIFTQFSIVVYYGVFGKVWNAHYLRFNDLSKFVMQHYPNLYNPVPEIFAERSSRKDSYSKNNVYYFIPKNSDIATKILIPENKKQEYLAQYPNANIIKTDENMLYLNIKNDNR